MNPVVLGIGKCSSFGGPNDTGMTWTEGLSCIETSDLKEYWFRRLFLEIKPNTGLGRSLNPDKLYCAMRFGYGSFNGKRGEILPGVPRDTIRRGLFEVSNHDGQSVLCQAADWGPNDFTDRLIDLSPGSLTRLNIHTDSMVTVKFFPPDNVPLVQPVTV